MIHLFMIQFKNMTHTSRFQGNVRKQTVNHDIIASSAGKPPTFSPLHKVKSNVQDYIRVYTGQPSCSEVSADLQPLHTLWEGIIDARSAIVLLLLLKVLIL
jgi:hypothetical protein